MNPSNLFKLNTIFYYSKCKRSLFILILYYCIILINISLIRNQNKNTSDFKLEYYKELLNNPNDVILKYVHLPFDVGYGSK